MATKKPHLDRYLSPQERTVLSRIISNELSKTERHLVLLHYGPDEMNIRELAATLRITTREARMHLLAAFIKMRLGMHLALQRLTP
ncbi:MAG: hypothetical protein K0S38_188 [Candidatus Paceibacter sp.]|jgi:hypothetical protein|nr:hypothetical protein [Candidatus Paceibacter sp.]